MKPNKYETYWQALETTRLVFYANGQRYCLRHILAYWQKTGLIDFHKATFNYSDGCRYNEPMTFDIFVWRIAAGMGVGGYDVLPAPYFDPLYHAKMLIYLVSLLENKGLCCVNRKALGLAYSTVFPGAKLPPIKLS